MEIHFVTPEQGNHESTLFLLHVWKLLFSYLNGDLEKD